MILFYTKHYKYVEYNETIFLLMKCNFEKFEIENNFNITFVFFFLNIISYELKQNFKP